MQDDDYGNRSARHLEDIVRLVERVQSQRERLKRMGVVVEPETTTTTNDNNNNYSTSNNNHTDHHAEPIPMIRPYSDESPLGSPLGVEEDPPSLHGVRLEEGTFANGGGEEGFRDEEVIETAVSVFRHEQRKTRLLWACAVLAFAAVAVVPLVVLSAGAEGLAEEIEPPTGSGGEQPLLPGKPSPLKPREGCFESHAELKTAVQEYLEDPTPGSAVARTYGYPIGTWCVSGISNFRGIFSAQDSKTPKLVENFNEPLGGWDVSSALLMGEMFYGAKSFDQDLSGWDVSHVLDFRNTFHGCERFNGDLSNWDVSSALHMQGMFASAQRFEGNGLQHWNTSSVTGMPRMFEGATAFNGDIGGWDVGQVRTLRHAFRDAISFNRDLHEWRFSPELKSIEGMLMHATSFNGRVNGWNLGDTQVTSLEQLFFVASSFNQPVGHWDVSKITNFREVFAGASKFNRYLASWDVSSATTMEGMFSHAESFDHDLSRWDVSGVQTMESMFQGATNFQQDLGNWTVSAVEDMGFMFANAHAFDSDLDRWDVRSVRRMPGMFKNARRFNGSIGNWDTSGVEVLDVMFWNARRFNQELGEWDLRSVRRMGGMFLGATGFDRSLCGWADSLRLPEAEEGGGTDEARIRALFGSAHSELPDDEHALFNATGCSQTENPVYLREEFVGPFCHPCTGKNRGP